MAWAGSKVRVAPPDDQASQRMWRSMRVLVQFTRGDIEATSEASRVHVGAYISKLTKAGYVVLVQKAHSRKAGDHDVLRLVKNTGPVAPRFGKDGIYDANIAEPLARLNDRPLCRNAPALLQILRLLVDRMRTQNIDEPLLADAEAIIQRAEGRA